MSLDRYDVDGLQALLGELRLESHFNQGDLGGLIEEVDTVDRSSPTHLGYGQRSVLFHLHLADSSAGNVGRVLVDVDRELRRTAAFIVKQSLRPVKSVGSVELLCASQTNSMDLVIVASKDMHQLMKSHPLTFVVTLTWFWEHRLTHTRSRLMQHGAGRLTNPLELIASGAAVLKVGHSVHVCLVIDGEGVTRAMFLDDLWRVGRD